ncbi:MAG: ATP-dependent RecD-like DNA helicase [Deltaproteobacteria bacterium]|jgi:exodeoxyribonuclease V alpha subunit|nr:ATP-dependent RecD-like DNA helicase [Deltaproteobacteria bacterium]
MPRTRPPASADLSLLAEPLRVELEGSLERVLFHNEENGYTVLRLKPRDKPESVTAVGVMHSPQVGVGLKIGGIWAEHPRFGRQLQFSSYEILLPATVEGIRHYLGSGLIRGIRRALAGRIVDRFGEDTMRVLDEEPERLTEVRGITPRLVEAISKSWEEHKSIRSLIMFLQPHDISTSYAVRIFRHYGTEALEVVRANPYRLAMDIPGIGFATADMLARKLGVETDSPLRAEAGVLYNLRGLVDEGNVYYPLDKLLEKSVADLDLPEDLAREAVNRLRDTERVVLEDLYDLRGFQHTGVYLAAGYHCECGIVRYLRRILHSPKAARFENAEEALNAGLSRTPVELAAGQIEAVRASLRDKVLVITGGPGTGKTTVINTIIKIFSARKGKVLLAAPTGRAARRLSETSGHEARTIHRLLEYSPTDDMFIRDEDNPLACSLLVVDEASMLDNMLMYYLLKAVPLGATLIFVGDANQLPSVGAGNVLCDIMASGAVPVVELTEVFRQAAESSIIMNAHLINQGQAPLLGAGEGRLSDFYFIRQEDPEKCADLVIELVCAHIPRRFGFNPVDEVQVLTPMHKGSAGVTALNARLQQALNRQTLFLKRGERRYFLDDKVMQIKNNYERGVYNGDIGRVCHVDVEERELTVRFEGNSFIYAQEELDELVPAYAISVHKSQGSEYPAVVLPLLTQHYMLLQRNLLYTAVTRGKKLVVIVGSPKAVHMAVRNDKPHRRFTWLAERLGEN